MSISKEILQNKFLLFLIEEQEYINHIIEISKKLHKSHKIAHVCLSRPYLDVISDMEKNKLDTKKFIFIDVLSSHYGKPEPDNNCIFIDGPTNLSEMKKAINHAISEQKCDVLMFDSISTLSLYADDFSIINFTHNLISSDEKINAKTLYFILKLGFGEDSNKLIKDLGMFADKTIDLNKR